MNNLSPISGLQGAPSSYLPRGGRILGEDGKIYDAVTIFDALVAMANAAISTVTVVSSTITATTRDGNTTYQCAARADIANIPATAAVGDTATVEADWSVWIKGVAGAWVEVTL